MKVRLITIQDAQTIATKTENVFKVRAASGSAPVFQDGRVRIAARQQNKTVRTRRTTMEVKSYLYYVKINLHIQTQDKLRGTFLNMLLNINVHCYLLYMPFEDR